MSLLNLAVVYSRDDVSRIRFLVGAQRRFAVAKPANAGSSSVVVPVWAYAVEEVGAFGFAVD